MTFVLLIKCYSFIEVRLIKLVLKFRGVMRHAGSSETKKSSSPPSPVALRRLDRSRAPRPFARLRTKSRRLRRRTRAGSSVWWAPPNAGRRGVIRGGNSSRCCRTRRASRLDCALCSSRRNGWNESRVGAHPTRRKSARRRPSSYRTRRASGRRARRAKERTRRGRLRGRGKPKRGARCSRRAFELNRRNGFR